MSYILRKVVLFVITLWAAITLNFILPRLMPGSPVDAALGKLAAAGQPITNAEKAAIEAQLGAPHGSMFSQYGDYLEEHRHAPVRHVVLVPDRDGGADDRQGTAVDAGAGRRHDGLRVRHRDPARRLRRVAPRPSSPTRR